MAIKESSEDSFITDDLVVTAASGKGIKVGDWTDRGGEVAQFGWRDITSQITLRGVGAADPTWAQIGSGAFFGYKFALNDQVYMAFHIPHDYVPDSPVYFHVHCLTDGTSTASLRWEFTYSYAKGFSQEAYDPAGTAVYAQQAPNGTAYTHMVIETDGVTIPGLDEPDGIIYVRIKRVANTDSPQADNTDDVFLLTSDVHYQSTNLATINKAPGFYG